MAARAFDAETAVTARGEGRYEAVLSTAWDIGDNANGGYAMLPVLRALRAESGHAPPPTAAAGGPHMCSWMQGREFCGRRFSTSEELMSHLRTHTSPSKPPTSSPEPALPASALALLQAQAAQLRAGGGIHRSSTPPNAESRYHPYGRSPAGGPSSLHAPPRPTLPVLP